MLFFMIFLTSIMLFLNHPMNMGFYILILTLITCLISGTLINTYWFSYILFLTFLGGLLVLFIYMSSIASNEMFNFSYKNFYLIIMMMIILTMLMFFFNKYNLNITYNDNFLNMNNMYLFFNNENKIKLSKIYNNNNFLLMMILIIYLFIALVAVIKITNIFQGPLRSNLF
uniref:NADH-ubiquinone oxidoreductase chain 6 n=1 Tax=Lyonetia clerkella TaxID=753195 RepID=A0A343XBN1_9NEOP|nr:NADH dehydrogenase subunit 6 [Lyonetia clerkella]AWK29936.1 NADH dehydrogenase subunit 6 [Lyonetia clerkella]